AGDRLCDADGSDGNVERSISFISRTRCAAAESFVGQPGGGRRAKPGNLSMANDLSRRDDGADAVFVEFFGRWIARCTRSADAESIGLWPSVLGLSQCGDRKSTRLNSSH